MLEDDSVVARGLLPLIFLFDGINPDGLPLDEHGRSARLLLHLLGRIVHISWLVVPALLVVQRWTRIAKSYQALLLRFESRKGVVEFLVVGEVLQSQLDVLAFVHRMAERLNAATVCADLGDHVGVLDEGVDAAVDIGQAALALVTMSFGMQDDGVARHVGRRKVDLLRIAVDLRNQLLLRISIVGGTREIGVVCLDQRAQVIQLENASMLVLRLLLLDLHVDVYLEGLPPVRFLIRRPRLVKLQAPTRVLRAQLRVDVRCHTFDHAKRLELVRVLNEVVRVVHPCVVLFAALLGGSLVGHGGVGLCLLTVCHGVRHVAGHDRGQG